MAMLGDSRDGFISKATNGGAAVVNKGGAHYGKAESSEH